MPAKNLIGDDNGISQIVTSQYIGDENGIAQKVVKIYVGDENGIAQLCFAGAGAKVSIWDADEQCYCVINGVTYNSGTTRDVDVEVGTPIEIYMPKIAMNDKTLVSMLTVNNGVSCNEFQHVASADCNIAFFREKVQLAESREAVIIAAKASCFLMDAGSAITTKVKKGFSYRSGMTWRQFVGSMYNNGHFAVGETDRVYFLPTNTIVTDPDADGAYVSADAKIVHNKTYE